MKILKRYADWLHLKWPAGKPEVLPIVQPDGTTNVSGLRVVGDLSGVPLLKLSMNGGVQAARAVAKELEDVPGEADGQVLDVAIVGGGAAGFAAAREADRLGLSYVVFEASEPFATIANFPRGKPIFKYPTELPLEGGFELQSRSDVKEGLIEELREQTVDQGLHHVRGRVSHIARGRGGLEVVLPDGSEPAAGAASLNGTGWVLGEQRVRARRVIVAIGRSGNYRKLGVPGEQLDHKVFNRLHDPKDFCGQDLLVVGGGDSAIEAAIALAECGSRVTLSYRKPEFSRPKPENRERLERLSAPLGGAEGSRGRGGGGAAEGGGRVDLMMASKVRAIKETEVDIEDAEGRVETLPNDAVFTLIGREAPLAFFRKSGVRILGERGGRWWLTLGVALLIATFVYQVKKTGTFLPLAEWWQARGLFPYGLGETLSGLWSRFGAPETLLGTLNRAVDAPGFWYSLLYCVLILGFGYRRILRRKTPYVTKQTITLAAIQVVPLFLLPYLLLPWLGNNGWFDGGGLGAVADALFPAVDYDPNGREYWRAFGLVLAWPLFLFNVFTDQPLWAWLGISLVQTFVLIPVLIYFFGKGAYCGWICSCGAMAETLGDTQRHKMPHGPFWNRLNFIGQAFLGIALLLLALRALGWMGVEPAEAAFTGVFKSHDQGGWLPGLNYVWFVDLLWAGILGFGLYFHFSGRVWCRFACPLAALMHIYGRFSRFRILSEKKKCISCNVCTSVCHQGIDVMSFANRGEPMADPQCVRCSACVQSCPTGVLSFGRVDRNQTPIARDPAWLAASPVLMLESAVTVEGRPRPSAAGPAAARVTP